MPNKTLRPKSFLKKLEKTKKKSCQKQRKMPNPTTIKTDATPATGNPGQKKNKIPEISPRSPVIAII